MTKDPPWIEAGEQLGSHSGASLYVQSGTQWWKGAGEKTPKVLSMTCAFPWCGDGHERAWGEHPKILHSQEDMWPQSLEQRQETHGQERWGGKMALDCLAASSTANIGVRA
jgi:hypothetical protein